MSARVGCVARGRAALAAGRPRAGWPLRAAGAVVLAFGVLLAPAHAAGPAPVATTDATVATVDNETLVRAAFDAWRAGTGTVFDLLADDVTWTVAGTSPMSGVYRGKQDFLDRAVTPITARLATPIVPEVEHVVAQGDAVVVVFRGTARTHDGGTYRNHFAWHMELEGGRIVRGVALLDTAALEALME